MSSPPEPSQTPDPQPVDLLGHYTVQQLLDLFAFLKDLTERLEDPEVL